MQLGKQTPESFSAKGKKLHLKEKDGQREREREEEREGEGERERKKKRRKSLKTKEEGNERGKGRVKSCHHPSSELLSTSFFLLSLLLHLLLLSLLYHHHLLLSLFLSSHPLPIFSSFPVGCFPDFILFFQKGTTSRGAVSLFDHLFLSSSFLSKIL